MRKGLLAQVILMTVALAASFTLNLMVLSFAVENHEMTYVHVAFSGLYFFVGLICMRILYELRDQKIAEEEEWIQHQLDMADDYASREL